MKTIKIIHTVGIPSKYSSDIRELLRLCDREFVPPLSFRDNTSQTDFKKEGGVSAEPVTYYKSLCSQENYFVVKDHTVIALMSYVKDYVSDVTAKHMPNVYISTLIVHPDYRRRGLAGKLYARMLKDNAQRYIFTRTWSQNNGHIRILSGLKFYECLRLENDRGEGIDTVYFRREPEKLKISAVLKNYHLHGNLIFFAALMALTLLFLVAWMNSKTEAGSKLFLAFATSLLASALCLLSDTFIKYREAKNDDYINKLKSFGISNLQFHKDQLLEQILPTCRDEIWISGYRLIMTGKKKFLSAIEGAASHSRKLKIRLLAVPPWTDAYKAVYGSDDVSRNYYNVFLTLARFKNQYGTKVEIRFTDTAIFNDTYKVDERFVTGPYLHCPGKNGMKITAKDFFSFDIDDPQKELYGIIYHDYTAVWDKSTQVFDLDRFYEKACDCDHDSFFENDCLQNYIVDPK